MTKGFQNIFIRFSLFSGPIGTKKAAEWQYF